MLMDYEDAAAAVARLDRMAWSLARRFLGVARGRGELADYHAAAVAGFWEAATRFDPDGGAKFDTYAFIWARKWVERLARQEAARGAHVPQHHGVTEFAVVPLPCVRGAEFPEYDVPAPEDDGREPPDPDRLWRKVRRAVPNRDQARAIEWHFRRGLPDSATAAATGQTKGTVAKQRARGLEYLRAFGADRLAEFVA